MYTLPAAAVAICSLSLKQAHRDLVAVEFYASAFTGFFDDISIVSVDVCSLLGITFLSVCSESCEPDTVTNMCVLTIPKAQLHGSNAVLSSL